MIRGDIDVAKNTHDCFIHRRQLLRLRRTLCQNSRLLSFSLNSNRLFPLSIQFHSLINLLESSSRGKISNDKAEEIPNSNEEIAEIEERIESHMRKVHSPIKSISGISFRLVVVIEAKVGDFGRFLSPDKTLVFVGLSPSIYQLGKFTSQNAVRNAVSDIYAMLCYRQRTLFLDFQKPLLII